MTEFKQLLMVWYGDCEVCGKKTFHTLEAIVVEEGISRTWVCLDCGKTTNQVEPFEDS